MNRSNKHYHFIGIGGIGVGTLATLMLTKGFRVSGSDLKENAMTKSLRKKGAQIFIGHEKNNIIGSDFIVFSSAVQADNPELVFARENKVPILRRAELLAQLMDSQIGITVAGAHGKTTTTSMISNLFIMAGLRPTTAVGGIVDGAAAYNAKVGQGKYFVAEVDESDGSFLYFSPEYSVITNIDFEHVDYYHSWENILGTYQRFIQRTSGKGQVVICGEDERLRKLAQESGRNFVSYGFSPECNVSAKDIRIQGLTSRFECWIDGKSRGEFILNVPGRHNVLNALACITLGWLFEIDWDVIRKSLKKYRGVQRRFQIKGEINDILVVDDYGHHPTEIKATLAAAQSLQRKRMIVAFQPHRYTRTKYLLDEFADSLLLPDYLIIADIYAASEAPMEGVTSQKLVEKITKRHPGEVVYLKREDILTHLKKIVRPGDLVLTLGAGDLNQIGEEFVCYLQNKSR